MAPHIFFQLPGSHLAYPTWVQCILAWEIPRTEEPGGRQSTRSKRVGQDLETKQQQASVYLACLLFLYVYGTVGLKEGQFCFPSPAYLAMSGDVFGHHN